MSCSHKSVSCKEIIRASPSWGICNDYREIHTLILCHISGSNSRQATCPLLWRRLTENPGSNSWCNSATHLQGLLPKMELGRCFRISSVKNFGNAGLGSTLAGPALKITVIHLEANTAALCPGSCSKQIVGIQHLLNQRGNCTFRAGVGRNLGHQGLEWTESGLHPWCVDGLQSKIPAVQIDSWTTRDWLVIRSVRMTSAQCIQGYLSPEDQVKTLLNLVVHQLLTSLRIGISVQNYKILWCFLGNENAKERPAEGDHLP